MRKDLFDAMMAGFEDVISAKSIKIVRRTDELLRQTSGLRGYFHRHGQVTPYDNPSYTFSKLQQDFKNSLEYIRFYGSPERQKENEEIEKRMTKRIYG